jgi:hypothetical protein
MDRLEQADDAPLLHSMTIGWQEELHHAQLRKY